ARLIERIEKIPHVCYAEPFIGMGGVFLRRRLRPPGEVINDRAGDVANLFRVLQRHPQALLAELELGLTSRVEFLRHRRVEPSTLTDVERAARFFYLQQIVFGGQPHGTFGTSALRPARFDLGRLRPLLAAVHRRLRAVTIEALDFQAFIERYDRPTTLFYADPPYWGCESDYGPNLFSRADFERLAAVLHRLKGRFILSINDRPEIRQVFAGFRIEAVGVTYRANGVKHVRELIISNRRRR
ncbi:MAG: DNA adenine methylase, partial [Stellaceae bacterium]